MSRIVLALPLVLLACDSEAPQPVQPLPAASTTVQRLGLEDVSGVAVADDALYVLDAWQGLFRWSDGELELVAGPDVLMPNGWDQRPFTDVVSMGGARFAVTVPSDGFLLDIDTQTSAQHFCYEPGFLDAIQVTHAVGYDYESNTLFAQPQSLQFEEIQSSHIGTYSGQGGGQPERWFDLENTQFVAGGMAADGDDVLLGFGSTMYTYTLGEADPQPVFDVEAHGLSDIQGMAIAGDTLYVVDGQQLMITENWR